jgi:predicted acetyltransferase
MINIRHRLNEFLAREGGHIGYSVRPSERRKGYATRMLQMALQKCAEMGLEKVLIACDKENIGSAKVIMNNGGVLESEITDGSLAEVVQRYWIDLSKYERKGM